MNRWLKISLLVLLVVSVAGGAYWYFFIYNKEELLPEPEPIVDTLISVAEIKGQFGYVDNKISPLYNVEKGTHFKLAFNSYLGDLPPSQVVTVHTSPESTVDSTLDTELVVESYQIGPSTFTLKPRESVLGDGGWGIAPIYYIRINYDLDADKPTLLKEPIIVPFTIKGDTEPSIISGNVNEDGVFSLGNDSGNLIQYTVYNLVRNVSTTYEQDRASVASSGFRGYYPLVLNSTSEKVYTSWGVHTGLSTATSNRGVTGAYYIRTGSNPVSNIIDVSPHAYKIPIQLESQLNGTVHKTIRSLPMTVNIRMLDGNIVSRAVSYNVETLAETDLENGIHVPYKINGTPYTGLVTIQGASKTDLLSLQSSSLDFGLGQFVEPKNWTKIAPSISLPTIIPDIDINSLNYNNEYADTGNSEGDSDGGDFSDGDFIGNEGRPSEGADYYEEISGLNSQRFLLSEGYYINYQYLVNKVLMSIENEKTVTLPAFIQELAYKPSVNSAFEYYLFLSMLNGEEEVSIEAFPDMQNYSSLKQSLLDVYYQNPLVPTISDWSYSYEERKLTIRYVEKLNYRDLLGKYLTTLDKIQMTDAVLTEKEIRKGIAPYKVSRGLSNREVFIEVLEYLNSVVAEGLGESQDIGVLIKESGNSLGYAKAVKLFADLIGLDAKVVVGDMKGYKKAWNKVDLGGGYVNLDILYNDYLMSVEKGLYFANDLTAKKLGYSESTIGNGKKVSTDSSTNEDPYLINDLEVDSVERYTKVLGRVIQNGEKVVYIRSMVNLDPQGVYDATGRAIQNYASEYLTSAKFYSRGNYYKIVLESEKD